MFETVWRRDPHENPLGKAFGRFGTIATALGYLALAVSAVRIAAAGRAAREGRTSPAGVVSSLEELALRIGVVAAGLVPVVLAVRSGYRGVRRRFVEDLRDGSPRIVVALGQAGLVGKGVTFANIGGLMIWTALEGRLGPPGIQTVFRLVNLSPAAESSLSSRRSGSRR